MDPLVFLASTLFVLGAGLFFIRIYPYLVRLIYKVGSALESGGICIVVDGEPIVGR